MGEGRWAGQAVAGELPQKYVAGTVPVSTEAVICCYYDPTRTRGTAWMLLSGALG